MKKSLAHSVWECKYHNESVKDDYDSNMDKDPFKGASNKEEDTDKQIAINLNTWPQISAFARVGLPLRGVSNNALIGRNQATGWAGGHDIHFIVGQLTHPVKGPSEIDTATTVFEINIFNLALFMVSGVSKTEP